MTGRSVGDGALSAAERELSRMQHRLDLLFLRLLLQRRVRYVSPLLIDMMAGERLRLEQLMFRMRPVDLSRRAQIGRYAVPMTHWRYLLPVGWQPELTVDQMDRLFRDAMSGRGICVRLPSHPKGHLGISASRETLGAEFGIGMVRVWSNGDDAFVMARCALPESVGNAIVGVPVGEIVEHHALTGRPYPIKEVRISEVDGDRFASTTIRFHTGHLPFEMPFRSIVNKLVRGTRAGFLAKRGAGSQKKISE